MNLFCLNFIASLLIILGSIIRIVHSDSAQTSDKYAISNSDSLLWKEHFINSVGIPRHAIDLAVNGFLYLKEHNLLRNDSLLTIIDYSKPSVDKRLFILDLKNERVVKNTLVAHGKNSGVQKAESFSNEINSLKSSLGLFITLNSFHGKLGYSLQIQGMNKGLNDNAFIRAIIVHGAHYVSEDFIKQYGCIGRSFGCPALPLDETEEIIDLIKNGTCLYIYHPVLISTSLSELGKI